ncbi:hypothetical protein FAIPA1_130150 [Frankia sp. AiPs1]
MADETDQDHRQRTCFSSKGTACLLTATVRSGYAITVASADAPDCPKSDTEQVEIRNWAELRVRLTCICKIGIGDRGLAVRAIAT